MPRGRKRTLGILAHVDAGKTTLSECVLYITGTIRKMGRVDHQDAFLDNFALERERGITIFSKQAEFTFNDIPFTLLDTPGHVDFSAEMERTLKVLDYAILVVNGADGVQGHTMTLWKLLQHYGVPVFLFVNKMDQEAAVKDSLLRELKERLSEAVIDFDDQDESFFENLALCDDRLMEAYLEGKDPKDSDIAEAVRARRVFPCYFGSALRVFGVEALLDGLARYTLDTVYPEAFGAKVFKITRDKQNQRLSHMKITGGVLRVKDFPDPGQEEKVDQIRVYSGTGYTLLKEAPAGTVCAVSGLTTTYSGQGLGIEAESEEPVLEPVLTYRIVLPPGSDLHGALLKLRQMEEEEPQLNIVYEEETGEIHARVMGEIEIEILKKQIEERFGLLVEFDTGSLIYKETIAGPVEGVGHYEPLRHYAEVHLLLEPLEPGSGLQFDTVCSGDVLAGNWQRLILTHLEEKQHKGVLTGSAITDMKISLLTGRAHLKHTEGGDFRQATYRAVRQGLMKAKSILLEPVYEFRLEIPADMTGRALSDIQKMFGQCESNEIRGTTAVLKGSAPVSAMREYQKEVTAYSRGTGRLFCAVKGYAPCHNTEEVLAARRYDPVADLVNSPDSVFCAHGAGFIVPWDQVEEYMHVESPLKPAVKQSMPAQPVRLVRHDVTLEEEKQLEEIFVRTYGPIDRERNRFSRNRIREEQESASRGRTGGGGAAEEARRSPIVRRTDLEKYLLVDGYNIIFAWEELKDLASVTLDGARNELMDILSNYQGYTEEHVILVFDAYKVKDNPGEVQRYHNIHVVYTREAETADQYIEKVVHEIGHKYDVTVATSDALEQLIIWGEGAMRMSAGELREAVQAVNIQIRDTYSRKNSREKNRPFQELLEKRGVQKNNGSAK